MNYEYVTDLDPREYALAVLWWWHDHADCPHICSRAYLEDGTRKRCPPPPPMPRWTTCPGYSLNQPRLIECGGCEACDGSSHVCHLTGETAPCAATEGLEAPPDAISLVADSNLLTRLEEHLGEGLSELPPEAAERKTEEIMAWLAICRPLIEAADSEDAHQLIDAWERFSELAWNELRDFGVGGAW